MSVICTLTFWDSVLGKSNYRDLHVSKPKNYWYLYPLKWFEPIQWKNSTLKSYVYPGYIVYSDKQHLEFEFKYWRNVSS